MERYRGSVVFCQGDCRDDGVRIASDHDFDDIVDVAGAHGFEVCLCGNRNSVDHVNDVAFLKPSLGARGLGVDF